MPDSDPPRLWFRPSQVAETTTVYARCRKCLHVRELDLSVLPDVLLIQIEPRLRCTWRGKDGKRPPCGSRADIEISVPTTYGPASMVSAPVLKDGEEWPGFRGPTETQRR